VRLYIEVNNNCFLRCLPCELFRREVVRSNQTLDVSFAERTAKEARELGFDEVVLTGGEPLLAPLLPRFVNIFKEHGFSVQIESSLFLPEKRAVKAVERLLKSGRPDGFIVNLSSLDDEYYGLPPGGRVYVDNFMEVATHLLIEGVPTSARVVMTSQLVGNLMQVFRVLSAVGVKDVFFDRFFYSRRLTEKESSIIPSKQEWFELVRTVKKLIYDYGKVVGIHILPSLNLFRAQMGVKPIKCPAYLKRAYIRYDRRLVGCFALRNEQFFCKDLNRMSLAEAVKEGAKHLHRRSLKGGAVSSRSGDSSITGEATKDDASVEKPVYCENCLNFDRCLGGCPAGRYISKGNVNIGPDPLCFAFDVVKIKDED